MVVGTYLLLLGFRNRTIFNYYFNMIPTFCIKVLYFTFHRIDDYGICVGNVNLIGGVNLVKVTANYYK